MIKFLSIFKLFFAFSLLLPIQLHAAGFYDGIYMINGDTTHYVSVHENSATNQMVVMVVNAEPFNNSWLALIGTLNENFVTVTSIAGVSDTDVVVNAKVVFHNADNATVTIQSCIDGVLYYCAFPTGATINMNRIF